MLKMVYCVRKRQEISDKEFYDYWLNMHGPLVAKHASPLNIKRYVQSHATEAQLTHEIAAERGMTIPGFDGIAEIWWDSQMDLDMALVTKVGHSSSKELAEDEARFIDLANSTIFFTNEHLIVDL